MNYSDPAIWDDLWAHNKPDALVVRLQRSRHASPDWHARYVHALAASGHIAEAEDQLQDAMSIYEGQPGMSLDLLRAVRLQLLITAEEYEQTLADAQVIHSTDPLKMEAACLTQYAVAYAHMSLGRPLQALMHIGQALGLSTALDLPHRTRVNQLLWTHIMRSMGEDTPRQMHLKLLASPHAATAQHGAMNLVEGSLYSGDYSQALADARAHNLPHMERIALALLGEFSDPAQPEKPTWCDQLVAGFKAAAEMRYAEIPVLDTNAMQISQYARLLNALRAMHAGTATSFEALLGDAPHARDQRAYWAGLRLIASLEGLIDDSPAQLTLDAIDALLAVPQLTHVVRLLEAVSPRTVLLLSHAPDSRLRGVFADVTTPFLLDTHVANHTKIRVPAQAAERLIAKSVGVNVVINGGYMGKYRERLARHSLEERRVVTVGDVYRYAEIIRQSATGGLSEAWDGVLLRLRRASPILDRAVVSRLRD